MGAPGNSGIRTAQTEQEIQNQGYDPTYGIPVVGLLGYNGSDVKRIQTNSSGQIIAETGATETYTTRLDEASSTVTYVGKATAGTAESASSWQIQKIGVSGTVTTISFADGDTDFDNVWDNRASLSYS